MDFASLLTKLEPVLGMTFALNLAYIGLPRFRYRETIRTHVRTKLDEVKDIPEQHCDTDWYKQLMRLANLDDQAPASQAAESDRMPSEIWSKLYTFIFEDHRDRAAVFGSACLCAILLFLGVAHELSLPVLNFTKPAFSADYIQWWFWLCASMAILPVACVWAGQYVVRNAKKFSDASIKNLKKTFQREAQEAAIDVAAPVPAVTVKPAQKKSAQ